MFGATKKETLTDDSPMPFGEHRTKPMKEVPASYLHWLWTTADRSKGSGRPAVTRYSPVFDYIEENMSALKKEFTDGIWE